MVSAPDALVYINGELEVIGCPNCTKVFDLNKYITSIQVDLNVDSPPGTASISLSVPRHIVDDFFFDGNPVITPMMEVEIYAKGYYLVEGLPQYYPIFWGMVTEVNDSYSGGEHSFSIQCADILKWWELCMMTTNAAWTAPTGQLGRNIFQNVFFGKNPYDIIWSLALQSFGDVVVGTNSLTTKTQERGRRGTQANAAMGDLMLYWSQRFSRIRSSLLLYGTSGATVRGDTLFQRYSAGKSRKNKPFASAAIQNANGGVDGGQNVFDPADSKVTAFRTQFNQAGPTDLWQSDNKQTKLEIANAAKESIGFEFFMDVTGDIVFKPPFYNLDVLGNKPQSWIQDIDIIDWDFGESEAEVVTMLQMQGAYGGNVDYGMDASVTPFSTVTDYHLLRKYGWRPHDYNSEFMGNTHMMFYHGLDVLDRLNSKRHRGSVTIPMRPELRLGFPMYIAPKDQVWYTQGISHNITFGGRAQTSLTLTAKRSKFIAPRGTATLTLSSPKGSSDSKKSRDDAFPVSSRTLSQKGKFKLNVENAAFTPPSEDAYLESLGADNPYSPLILRHPKTGRLVGYPNAVMVYTRPFSATQAGAEKRAGRKTGGRSTATSKRRQKRQAEISEQDADTLLALTDDEDSALRDKFLANRFQYGLNSAGVFVYAHDQSKVIGEAVTIPSANVDVSPPEVLQEFGRGLVTIKGRKVKRPRTALIRPVSDERGFEVIGHYRYGRRVALRDGRLVLNGNLDPAQINVTTALSGDVFSTLTAQSQGLTAISTGVENPAVALTSMAPDDPTMQTAGMLNPQTGKAEFTDVGDAFIDNAPTSSEERKGVGVTVEATQLSRALTLTEMGVKIGKQRAEEPDCPCVVGRSDLAFMSAGYKVKVLNTSAPDVSQIITGNRAAFVDEEGVSGFLPDTSVPIQEGRGQELQQNVNVLDQRIVDLNAQLDEAKIELGKLNAGARSRKARRALAVAQQRVTDISNQIDATERERDSQQGTLDELAKVPQVDGGGVIPTGSHSEVAGLVDTFLINLYKALDKPHQEYEKAIRGDLIPRGKGDDVENARSGTDQEESAFAPPFSAPGRFQLGDGAAARVGDISSNAEGLAKAWSDFSGNLKREAQTTKLTERINNADQGIARLKDQRSTLEKQLEDNAVVIGIDVESEIERVDQRIADLEQQQANDRLKLQGLN